MKITITTENGDIHTIQSGDGVAITDAVKLPGVVNYDEIDHTGFSDYAFDYCPETHQEHKGIQYKCDGVPHRVFYTTEAEIS